MPVKNRNGWLGSKVVSANTTNLTQLKGAPGSFGGFYGSNVNAAARWLKLYDALAANVTVGTTVPKYTFELPPNGTLPAVFPPSSESGLAFDTAISYAITASSGDSDSTAVAAGEIVVNFFYF